MKYGPIRVIRVPQQYSCIFTFEGPQLLKGTYTRGNNLSNLVDISGARHILASLASCKGFCVTHSFNFLPFYTDRAVASMRQDEALASSTMLKQKNTVGKIIPTKHVPLSDIDKPTEVRCAKIIDQPK